MPIFICCLPLWNISNHYKQKASCHFENWPCNCLSLHALFIWTFIKSSNRGYKYSSFNEINLLMWRSSLNAEVSLSWPGFSTCLSVLLASCSTWQGWWAVRKEGFVGLWQCFEMHINQVWNLNCQSAEKNPLKILPNHRWWLLMEA